MLHLFTSESVSEGHPDKVCDQISDAILDAYLEIDKNARVACETFATTGLVVIGGEITTTVEAKAKVEPSKIARQVITDIGYTKSEYKFDAGSCGIISTIDTQSPDIAMGVDTGGAGDQGLMFGYACNETKELMPLPIILAHHLVRRLTYIRKKELKKMPYLRPDAKSQVTIEYDEHNRARRVHTIVISTQHDPNVRKEKIKSDVIEHVIKKVIPANLFDKKTIIHVNPTGKFVTGGPYGDTGLTGRKIIVDTYGGKSPHGGGAFSGKDPSKVDRSAAYAARHIAKNIVAAKLASECLIQLAYAIGVAEPVSIMIDTHGTGIISDAKLAELINKEIDFTPQGIIKRLDLRRPIYRKTSNYGHFGRNEKEFTWEKLDIVPLLKKLLK